MIFSNREYCVNPLYQSLALLSMVMLQCRAMSLLCKNITGILQLMVGIFLFLYCKSGLRGRHYSAALDYNQRQYCRPYTRLSKIKDTSRCNIHTDAIVRSFSCFTAVAVSALQGFEPRRY